MRYRFAFNDRPGVSREYLATVAGGVTHYNCQSCHVPAPLR